MKVKLTAFFLCLLFLLPLGGCSRHSTGDSPSPLRVVTKIDIAFENGPIHCRRHYYENEKMSQILGYLRRIDTYGAAHEDPQSSDGSLFQITLSYSDGSTRIYEQKSDRFLRMDHGPWKNIDPSKAEELSLLLGKLDSDPEEI